MAAASQSRQAKDGSGDLRAPARSSSPTGGGLPRQIQQEIRHTAAPGKERDAMSRLARAIELLERDEPKAEAVIVAASALADQGRFAEALAFLGRARTREDVAEDYTLRLWYVKGDILERAGRRAEAATEFRKVMRHDPS